METTGFGRDKYRKIVKQLQEIGYLEIKNKHGEDGRFEGTIWEIHDDPEAQDVDTEGLKNRPPVTEGLKNPPPVKPAGGEIRPLKDNNLNKDTKPIKPPNPPRGAGKRFRKSGFSASQESLHRIQAQLKAEEETS
ncbi:hypothetical protein [uncultured Ruegeria sp.]|uniref:hypothetical protein n=1 Tax=uncultured Ruegeria sp. TaxID=259304 RepID=UPI002627E074|nr:hypothetical protein [uncultured Ruegeria sp.]